MEPRWTHLSDMFKDISGRGGTGVGELDMFRNIAGRNGVST